MALVTYADSESSEDESPVTQTAAATLDSTSKHPHSEEPAPAISSSIISTTPVSKQTDPGFSPLVSRDNPRKIKIALPEIKKEVTGEVDGDAEADEAGGPARKKVKVTGTGGGLFSGFNTLLPAPKRAANVGRNASSGGSGTTTRKIFSLKTGAAPGFDRGAFDDGDNEEGDVALSTLKAGSLREKNDGGSSTRQGNKHNAESLLKEEDFRKKGNAMMFKPLSVARSSGSNSQKKKIIASSSAATAAFPPTLASSSVVQTHRTHEIDPATGTETAIPAPLAPAHPASKKPQASLFSFSDSDPVSGSEPSANIINSSSSRSGAYESILYQSSSGQGEQDLSPDSILNNASAPLYHLEPTPLSSSTPTPSQTLDDIASDLNLSRSQRRQLLGRNPHAALANPQIRTFQTDAEYAANQEFLAKRTDEDLAAAQHNPVRAIAPGKHSLKQLINAAQSQKDALEESFATGKRNKKEAGSRYGW